MYGYHKYMAYFFLLDMSASLSAIILNDLQHKLASHATSGVIQSLIIGFNFFFFSDSVLFFFFFFVVNFVIH